MVDLINMNGRVYDPVLGRFLSPDPYVQLPDYSQSYNRYSYCFNNPMIYTDPSGLRTFYGERGYDGEPNVNKHRKLDCDGTGGFMLNAMSSLLGSVYGGSYSAGTGMYYSKSSDEGLLAGSVYNMIHNSWEQTEGKSFLGTLFLYKTEQSKQYLTASLDYVGGDRPEDDTPWMLTALVELGVSEVGSLHSDVNSPRIIQYFNETVLKGQEGTKTWGWCSAFANWCLAQSNIIGSRGGKPDSWLNWGQDLGSNPAFGALAIQKGHVGFVVGYNNSGNVLLLGGNQPDVSLWAVPTGTIIKYVYPLGNSPNHNLNTYNVNWTDKNFGF